MAEEKKPFNKCLLYILIGLMVLTGSVNSIFNKILQKLTSKGYLFEQHHWIITFGMFLGELVSIFPYIYIVIKRKQKAAAGGENLLAKEEKENEEKDKEEFERLNYGYRIINNFVTPITAKEEVESIEEAIDNAKDNIKEHLRSASKHLADKEKPNYRTSIKESISAVGVLCREMTGENDLGKALFALEKKQGKLHSQLKGAFENLYRYVNEKQSGIRHELMDASGIYVPTFHEAKCYAFINYLNGKFGSNK